MTAAAMATMATVEAATTTTAHFSPSPRRRNYESREERTASPVARLELEAFILLVGLAVARCLFAPHASSRVGGQEV
jgi:hypothetical protein